MLRILMNEEAHGRGDSCNWGDWVKLVSLIKMGSFQRQLIGGEADLVLVT